MIECFHGTCISESNDKMGKIPSFSTLPGITCGKDVPCRDDCYAEWMISTYRKNVRPSWEKNTQLVLDGKFGKIADDIISYIRFRHSLMFRWFVGGDIYSRQMLEMMCFIAEECPETTFLCFTKRYEFFEERKRETIPDNLVIVLSAWKKYRPSSELMMEYPFCYLDDGTSECEVPEDAARCRGSCMDCKKCFGISAGESVAIHKH